MSRKRKNRISNFGNIHMDAVLDAEEQAYFSNYEANSEEQLSKRIEAVKSNNREDDLELCTFCAKKKAIFITKQSRSADEGMTYIYKCTACDKTWTVR
jgi:DNA-directed RNA polymerase subunit M/transcription elongation factor TFIIS